MRLFHLYCAIALVAIGITQADGKNYCPKMPEPKAEGDTWYIPESAFTKEAANKAIKELATQINKGVADRDFSIDNDLKMIKGYLYLAYLAEHKKAFGSEDEELREDFCKFLKAEAFVSH